MLEYAHHRSSIINFYVRAKFAVLRVRICRFMSGVTSKRNQYWAYMEKSLRATTWRQSKCSHSESMFDTQIKQWLTSVLLCWNDLWPTGAIPRRITDVQFCSIFSSPTETLNSFHIYLCFDSKDLWNLVTRNTYQVRMFCLEQQKCCYFLFTYYFKCEVLVKVKSVSIQIH